MKRNLKSMLLVSAMTVGLSLSMVSAKPHSRTVPSPGIDPREYGKPARAWKWDLGLIAVWCPKLACNTGNGAHLAQLCLG